MPSCLVHPHIEETEPCAGCGRPFCARCLAEIMGRRLCEECKFHAVQGAIRPRSRHPLATVSVVLPVVGYFTLCLIPVTSLVGLYLGWKVLNEIREQPHLSGRSAALAGMVISGGTLATLLIGVAAALVLTFRR